MASPTSAQQRTAEESLEEFDTRMLNMVSRLDTLEAIFFYKLACKSMVTDAVQGQYSYALEFPRDFLDEHSKKFGLDVTFETPNNHQMWPIKITVRTFQDSRTRLFAYGAGGWKAFVMENHIKVGDVLIFELTRFAHFEVVIGRSPMEVHSNEDEDQDNANQDNAGQTSLRATSSNTLWPKFMVTICRPSQPEHPENHFYLEKDLSLVVPSPFWELHSHMLDSNELRLKGPTKTITTVKVERTCKEGVQKVCLMHSAESFPSYQQSCGW